MQILHNATYKNGTLILDERLGVEKEGRKFKIILLEQESNHTRKERFLKFVEKHEFKLPKDYRFDRDELHERG